MAHHTPGFRVFRSATMRGPDRLRNTAPRGVALKNHRYHLVCTTLHLAHCSKVTLTGRPERGMPARAYLSPAAAHSALYLGVQMSDSL